MKPVRLRRIATALAIAGASTVLVGCGSKNNSNPPPIVSNPNGTIPGGGFPGGGGCVPINQAIPFTGQGIYFSYASIVGGNIPGNNQPVGQVLVGGSLAQGQFGTQAGRNAVDLNINMSITPAQMQYQGQVPNQFYPNQVPTQYQNPTYPGPIAGYNQWSGFGQQPGLANVTGVITINPMTQQQIISQFGGGYGQQLPGQYPGQYPSQYPSQYPGSQMPGQYGQVPCVSGVAFNLGNYHGVLYGGFVWLYLNGTQHGVYYPI